MKTALRAGSVIAIAALAGVAVVLLVGRISASRDANPAARQNAVVAAAMKASIFGTHLFPRSQGKRTCTIHGGGPAPGVSFPGAICKTRVVFGRRGTASVYFTHWINGKPHTWLYHVSPSLHARFVRDFGPGFTPEYMS